MQDPTGGWWLRGGSLYQDTGQLKHFKDKSFNSMKSGMGGGV